jgi:hypothetical protein
MQNHDLCHNPFCEPRLPEVLRRSEYDLNRRTWSDPGCLPDSYSRWKRRPGLKDDVTPPFARKEVAIFRVGIWASSAARVPQERL